MMKKLLMIAALVLGALMPTKAQISLNVNLSAQPLWGPAGYNHAEYYYLPDIETYYYVPKKQFVYLNEGQWNFSSALPARYSSYDLYNGYKVVLNSPTPYRDFSNHKVKYAKFKNNGGKQLTLKNKKKASNPNANFHSAYTTNKGNGASLKAKGSAPNVHVSSGNGNGKTKGNGNGKANGNGNGKGKH